MIIKGIRDEDFTQYKKPSMFVIFPSCSFKCEIDCGEKICQNSNLAHAKSIEMSKRDIVKRYMGNPITKAVVFGGLEPFDSIFLISLIAEFRKYTNDDIVIYSGYTKDELEEDGILLMIRKEFKNVIVKFGRYIPNQESHYDEVLGVTLASSNQYAERIS